MDRKAIKEFDIEERTIENMWYEIVVKFRGRIVEKFVARTMQEAQGMFAAAGYIRTNAFSLRKNLPVG